VVDASFEADIAVFDSSASTSNYELETFVSKGGHSWGWHSEWSIDSMMTGGDIIKKQASVQNVRLAKYRKHISKKPRTAPPAQHSTVMDLKLLLVVSLEIQEVLSSRCIGTRSLVGQP